MFQATVHSGVIFTHTHTHSHTCARTHTHTHTHTHTSTCTRSHIPINTHFWSTSQNSLHRQWHTLPNTGTLFLSAPVVCLVAVRSQTLPFIPRQRLFVSSEIMCLLTLLPVFTLTNSRRHHLTKVRVVLSPNTVSSTLPSPPRSHHALLFGIMYRLQTSSPHALTLTDSLIAQNRVSDAKSCDDR